MARVSAARRTAHHVLLRVDRDSAFAERALETAIERNRLSPADRALATELVYGTLRHQGRLDFILSRLLRQPLRKLSTLALVGLRLGVYQLLETRVPDHAAVNDSVSLVRERQARLAGTVNAVLRKVQNLRDAGELPDPAAAFEDPIEALAVESSHPVWLVRRISNTRGDAAARAWVEANNERPALGIRVNRRRTSRDELLQRFRDAGIDAEAAPIGIPSAIQLRAQGRVVDLPGFAEGEFTVQDPAAQAVSMLADVQPGQVILDACAAPGGKSTHLAELIDDEGRVIAVDVHPGKTRLITDTASRLGLASITPIVVDATAADAFVGKLAAADVGKVDVAVLDVPCSGLGTLRRNPELRQRKEAELPLLTQLQDRLLDTVAPVVTPGGLLVYSVCTITDEEGPERIEAFLSRHHDFAIERPGGGSVERLVDDTGALRTWTDLHHADSFFAVRLRRAG